VAGAAGAVHDPGKILTDLALTVALGGDCLADVAVLRAQPELRGPVASDPVVSRPVDRETSTQNAHHSACSRSSDRRYKGAIKDSGSDRRRSAWSNRGCWPIKIKLRRYLAQHTHLTQEHFPRSVTARDRMTSV
jgi:hypothetical protein